MFTPEAEDTFVALVSQLLDRWGSEYVQQFEDRVIKALNIISNTPLLYSVFLKSHQIRRCVIHQNCSILFKVTEDAILIVCFWDNRQEPLFLE